MAKAPYIQTPSDEIALEQGCYFDDAAADHVCRFFEDHLRHTKGRWAGQPFTPLPWQRDRLLRPLFGWMRPDGTRRFRTAFVEIPKKNGKALALDTPIPTPGGWVAMGALAVGDTVFDDDGNPCTITAATEAMLDRECYRVAFSNGDAIVADADHQWAVEAFSRDYKPGIVTTRELAIDTTVGGNNTKNYRLSVAKALQLPDVELPIDPYTLGVWLGDGHSSSARVTMHRDDAAAMERIASAGYKTWVAPAQADREVPAFAIGKRYPELCRRGHAKADHAPNGVCLACARELDRAKRAGLPQPPVTCGTLQEALRTEGLIGNKHIPAAYLRASERQRMDLLRGLMDTDGYVSKAGQCEYSTTRIELATGFLELATTLGIKASLRSKRAMCNGKDCGIAYSVMFFEYADRPVAYLARKADRQKPRPEKDSRARRIHVESVESVSSVPVRCIEVDSPSSLYLAGRTMIPTHNSALCSGIGLYLLAADGEAGSEVYCAAADRDQAGIVYREASAMAKASPLLKRYVKASDSVKNLAIPSSHSFLRAISHESTTAEGLNIHGLVFDELHAQKTRDLWDTLRYGGRARRQPLLISITTAGYDRHSICWEQYDYTRRILAGETGYVEDIGHFGLIYEAPEDADWTSPEVWRDANPSMGAIFSEEEMAAACREAQAQPTRENAFRRYLLNQWTEQDIRWLPLTQWDDCGGSVDPAALRGQRCYAGLDLSSRQDLTAFVLFFPESNTVIPHFWIPAENARERERRDHVPYTTWARAGHLNMTPGNVVDYAAVRKTILEAGRDYDLREIAFDRWGVEAIRQTLCDEGLDGDLFVEFGQGYASMSAPSKNLADRLAEGRLNHGDHPVLRWCAGNVTVDQDPSGNIKPNKAKSTERIDGIVALVMAIGAASVSTSRRSVYEERGLLTFGVEA